jgi:hypothetical protein
MVGTSTIPVRSRKRHIIIDMDMDMEVLNNGRLGGKHVLVIHVVITVGRDGENEVQRPTGLAWLFNLVIIILFPS